MLKKLIFTGLLAISTVHASTAWGTLNNFDCVNDTGVDAHGFDIELEDVRSTDITYTYDYNHYGAPKITQDDSNPLHPKVLIRYAGVRRPDGTWTAYTAIPSGQILPTQGHDFTNPSINFGGEHFGVGYYGAPTAVRNFWLIDDGTGNLVRGPAVNVATPTFVYNPPQPAIAANVVAVIVPPPPVEQPVFRFGDAMWVKAIKTTTHNNNEIRLVELVGDDPGQPQPWANGEPDEVEVEWRLLQTEFANADNPKGFLEGGAEELPEGDEIITRRYEFYKYTGPLDGESGEAMADAVGADGLHGTGSVSFNSYFDPKLGEWVVETVDLSQVEVVGAFFGAQMSGFDVAPGLGLIDNLQDGEVNSPYTPRTIVIGGLPPVLTTIAEPLPPGLSFDTVSAILSGTPLASGTFTLTFSSEDSAGTNVTKVYTLKIVGPNVPAIVPDQAVLPVLSGECQVSITAAPTANSGAIIATTTNPLVYSAQGNWTVTWTFNDGKGNTLTQTQSVTVQDTTAPVPDLAILPTLSGAGSVQVTVAPTATDNCAGTIPGTTTDPLNYSTAGTYTITWLFQDLAGNSTTQTQNVVVTNPLVPTALTYSGATRGHVGGNVWLKAILKTDAGAPLPGQRIVFTMGAQTIVALSNDRGVASTRLTLNQPSGTYTVQAEFNETSTYAQSSASSSFVIRSKKR